ncbi:MAG TPA: DsrE family protein [Armatimonadota bacterium]|jgi:uncharacterized protein involved in oxidation of intracellular sulfur
MATLLILSDSPYGSERSFNGLRLASALQKDQTPGAVRVFLLSDAVTCALPNQLRPEGASNVEQMLTELLASGAEVKACMTCVDQRGLFKLSLIQGVQIGSMAELAAWTQSSERVITF